MGQNLKVLEKKAWKQTKNKMRIAVFSTKGFDKRYFEEFNPQYNHELVFFEAPLNLNTVNLSAGFEGICVFVNDVLDKEVVNELAKNGVKIIALRCAGFNNVDIQAASEKNITVVRVPSYSPQAVAEHALALIMTLNRKTHKAYNRVRDGNFALDGLLGFDMYGKKVGVIGTGHIGTIFCRIMAGLGCEVLAYDKFPNQDLGLTYVSLDELYTSSDIISLHCPLLPETNHLINEMSLAQMKDGVMIINTSRGALIDSKAVIKGLKSKKVGYLGIDVYEQESDLFFQDLSESIIEDDQIMRLLTFPNVIVTSHQGFFTKEALEEITKTTFENITAFEKGETLVNQVK